MTFDDFLFYLPGYASIPLILAGVLAMWLAYRLVSVRREKRKKKDALENLPKM